MAATVGPGVMQAIDILNKGIFYPVGNGVCPQNVNLPPLSGAEIAQIRSIYSQAGYASVVSEVNGKPVLIFGRKKK